MREKEGIFLAVLTQMCENPICRPASCMNHNGFYPGVLGTFTPVADTFCPRIEPRVKADIIDLVRGAWFDEQQPKAEQSTDHFCTLL
jgi:hypothetical protein